MTLNESFMNESIRSYMWWIWPKDDLTLERADYSLLHYIDYGITQQ